MRRADPHIYCNLIFEDILSEIVMKKLLTHTGRPYEIGDCHLGRGNGFIKKTIAGFNNASKGMPHFILTDSDNYRCPIDLIQDYLPGNIHPNMIFRIAVNEVESWVLADREGFAQYLRINVERIPLDCDSIADPKVHIISLARRCRNNYLKRGIIPKSGSTAKQGPYFNDCLIPFVKDNWDINNACNHSESLSRALRALSTFNPVNH
jgi:hypothetical protein